jgi:hypothetical protein
MTPSLPLESKKKENQNISIITENEFVVDDVIGGIRRSKNERLRDKENLSF